MARHRSLPRVLAASLALAASACASGPMAADKRRAETPPPERTSDRGDRLLIPTPVGRIAPEVAPVVPPPAR